MRHFYNTLHTKGIFFTILRKDGTLESNVYEGSKYITENPIRALASCLEISHSDLVKYVATGVDSTLAPNETRVIDEFVAFHRLSSGVFADSAYEALKGVHCFQYTNLNEGKSVVWFLSLEV
jgi:hypothetical protein